MTKALVVAAIVAGSLMSGVGAEADGAVGDLSGAVQLDGEALAGVEVFLGINPPFQDPEFEARFTCTDENGDFSFVDVPLDTPLISITGTGGGAECSNEKFVDPSSTPAHPLLHTTVVPFGTEIAESTDVGDISVNRIPDEHAGIVAQARKALDFCYDRHDGEMAVDRVDTMLALVDEKEVSGEISTQAAETLRFYGTNLLFGGSLSPVCPVP